jgi:hypothetical protein
VYHMQYATWEALAVKPPRYLSLVVRPMGGGDHSAASGHFATP